MADFQGRTVKLPGSIYYASESPNKIRQPGMEPQNISEWSERSNLKTLGLLEFLVEFSATPKLHLNFWISELLNDRFLSADWVDE